MLQLAATNVQQAEEQLRVAKVALKEWRDDHPEDDCLTGRGLLLSKKVKREQANVKIHQQTDNYTPFTTQPDGQVYSTTPFQILNGMLNSLDATQYPRFQETVDVVVKDILDSSDLVLLSEEYDNFFLMPMRAKGGRPSSSDNESDSSSNKSNGFKSNVRRRDENRCVLTGTPAVNPGSRTLTNLQVAHFIPQCLLNGKNYPEDLKSKTLDVPKYIRRICPWLPEDFFEILDVCQNAILLDSSLAYPSFCAFEWFVTMETGSDGSTVYKAMEVEETGLLRKRAGMERFMGEDNIWMEIKAIISSYNQPLFIGNSHPQPGEIYVRLHEMMARIFKARGHAEYYECDFDDEEDIY